MAEMKSPSKNLQIVVDKYCPDVKYFEEIYRKIHNNPELSLQESETAKLVAEHLNGMGFDEVLTGIGSNGVVAILRNGEGPKVMLRADMDALPQEEKTGLPYASTKKGKDKNGDTVPIMHACGHDFHVATLLAVSKLLHSARNEWIGTLMCLFQPAEEDGAGAEKMINDRLYERVPIPDILLGQHVTGARSGTIQIEAGPTQSACDCFDVRIFGKGSHGSEPHLSRDPMIAACSIVLRLQTIVSREVPPDDVAVITCAYLHGGRAINIIPDYVDMKVDLRTYNPIVRERATKSIKRIIFAECEASDLPKKPVITQTDNIPAVINDSTVVGVLREVFHERFGDNLERAERDFGSDDFSILGEAKSIPYCYWRYGGTNSETWDRAKSEGHLQDLPNNHSSYFGPVIEPTLRTGLFAMSLGALAFLGETQN